MSRSARAVLCFIVTLALAAPALAEAQAKGGGRGSAGRSSSKSLRSRGGWSHGHGYRSVRGVGHGSRLGRHGSAGKSAVERPGRIETGSVRLKVTPAAAMVYIDGALVGTVADFDGLTDHLQLGGGMHTLELRADGYETYAGEITVAAGKTMTERVTLNKRK